MAVLLLNASLQPLNVISHRRLVVLLSKERVAFLDTDAEVRAVAALQDRRIPEDVVIVRLLRNIHVPRRVLRPNRRNLLLRDDNTCQYCGIVTVPAELTVDHVIPVSRGGAPGQLGQRGARLQAVQLAKGGSAPRRGRDAPAARAAPPDPGVRPHHLPALPGAEGRLRRLLRQRGRSGDSGPRPLRVVDGHEGWARALIQLSRCTHLPGADPKAMVDDMNPPRAARIGPGRDCAARGKGRPSASTQLDS